MIFSEAALMVEVQATHCFQILWAIINSPPPSLSCNLQRFQSYQQQKELLGQKFVVVLNIIRYHQRTVIWLVVYAAL